MAEATMRTSDAFAVAPTVAEYTAWARTFYDLAYWRRCLTCTCWVVPDFRLKPQEQRTICRACEPAATREEPR